MGKLDDTDELPRTILYCLNPRDNEVLATLKNCFQQGGVVAKIQFGSGWWFCDQKDGMEAQLKASQKENSYQQASQYSSLRLSGSCHNRYINDSRSALYYGRA